MENNNNKSMELINTIRTGLICAAIGATAYAGCMIMLTSMIH